MLVSLSCVNYCEAFSSRVVKLFDIVLIDKSHSRRSGQMLFGLL